MLRLPALSRSSVGVRSFFTAGAKAPNANLIVHAAYVIPIVPEGVKRNQSIVINNGRIVAIHPYRDEAMQRYQAYEEVDLMTTPHVVIPGLVNSHNHAAMTLFRGFTGDMPLFEWLHDYIFPAEARFVNDAFVQDGTRLAMAEMIRSGTTTFMDMYLCPPASAAAAVSVGMRCLVGSHVSMHPSPCGKTEEEHIKSALLFDDAMKAYQSTNPNALVRNCLAPHAPYTVTDATIKRLHEVAQAREIPVHMHVHETTREVQESINLTGMRPLQRLDKFGILGPRFMAVHMTDVSDDEMSMLADRGVHVIHCPESNLKLSSGRCLISKMRHRGLNVALGTDGAASNNDLDMLTEMRVATLISNGFDGPGATKSFEAIKMATLNGAKALGLDKEIGSLEVGKQADMVALRADSPETVPIYDPIQHLVYTFGRDNVTDVWVNGRALMRNRTLLTVDPRAMAQRALEWAAQITPTLKKRGI